jgi:hypothetical protein
MWMFMMALNCPAKVKKMAVRTRLDKIGWGYQRSLPGTPDTEFLLDKSLCLLWKKAQGITTEINARVLAWGGRGASTGV